MDRSKHCPIYHHHYDQYASKNGKNSTYFLKKDDCCGGQPMWGTYGDTSQDTIQKWFVVTALLCVPLMLLPKPLY